MRVERGRGGWMIMKTFRDVFDATYEEIAETGTRKVIPKNFLKRNMPPVPGVSRQRGNHAIWENIEALGAQKFRDTRAS
jgi:hypothetical protein